MNKTNQIFFLSASLLFMGCSAVNGKGKEAGGAEPDSPVFVAGSYPARNEEGIKDARRGVAFTANYSGGSLTVSGAAVRRR